MENNNITEKEKPEEFLDEVSRTITVEYAPTTCRPLFYPKNDTAETFLELMKKKSFTKNQLEYLKKRGFIVKVTFSQGFYAGHEPKI